ncbi:response regulator [Gilvimarinus xylanilyticus]|uniref:Response regulator n=1 Tax=Gilvimarinus xylanilyticus TaxID=2944139 RepID=A0A9X2HXG9_9GAMM|nr:response regulator [Gilvimarinus xylanilyticus]MCP8898824.1 response regulator [Gilvimarinus xylanilyticus]
MSIGTFADRKVLIVDRFENFRMTVMHTLQAQGCLQVDTAVNGADAMRKSRFRRYDVVICEYDLGEGKSGLQLLETLREEKLLSAEGIFVLLSAELSKALVLAATDVSLDAFLAKPVASKHLLQRLSRLLRKRRVFAPVAQALDEGDSPRARALCAVLAAGNSPYKLAAQKLLGQLLLENGDFIQAERLYREIMEVKELDWAQLGLAYSKRGQGDFKAAEQWLEQALVSNGDCVAAYDALAELHGENLDPAAQQRALQHAVQVSPLTVRRQQRLGEVALNNRDLPVATQALRQAIRLGHHSTYDQPYTHFQFVRACSELSFLDRERGRGFDAEVSRVLSGFASRFALTDELALALHSVECAFRAVTGDGAHSRQLLSQLQAEHDLPEVPATVLLDWVSAADCLNEFTLRERLLQHMLDVYRDQEAVLEQMDLFLTLPVSRKKRERLAQLNKRGIGLYERQEFAQAIACFDQALQEFPRHGSVSLNLLQALVGGMTHSEQPLPYQQKAGPLVHHIDKRLNLTDEQRNRFGQLQRQWRHMAERS